MKTYRTPKLSRELIAAVGGFALFTAALQGASFSYSPGDLVLAIRQTGNASDLVVNIGKATNYATLPTGAILVASNLSVAQINAAFPSVNELSWSVAAAARPPGVGSFPLQTLWVAAPRADANTQTAAWLRKGQFAQGTAAAQIDVIGLNAAAYSSSQPSNENNTVTGVVIPSTGSYALSPVIGASGNYNSTFQGNAENTTAADFDADASNVSRSDLYELLPGALGDNTYNTAGRYLGYFELKPDGTLTFNTTSPPPPRPTITGIARAGTVTTVSFTTVANATYSLLSADAGLSAPSSTWTVGSSVSGNGSVLSLQDTNSAAVRFFSVQAQSQ
jgi:hypothetical protein